MAWIRMPEAQQRGTQVPAGERSHGAPVEAVGGREGMGHR